MSSQERTESFDDILDGGETHESSFFEASFRFMFRQSESGPTDQKPESKMDLDFGVRPHISLV